MVRGYLAPSEIKENWYLTDGVLVSVSISLSEWLLSDISYSSSCFDGIGRCLPAINDGAKARLLIDDGESSCGTGRSISDSCELLRNVLKYF